MKSTNKKIEIGLKSFLENEPDFTGVEIYAHHESDEASDIHPSIIIHCESTERDTNLPLSMNVYNANIKTHLFWDYNDGDRSDLEESLELCLSSIQALQELFNLQDPPQPRPVEGLHVHYIQSQQGDSETDGTIKMFTLETNIILEQVEL